MKTLFRILLVLWAINGLGHVLLGSFTITSTVPDLYWRCGGVAQCMVAGALLWWPARKRQPQRASAS